MSSTDETSTYTCSMCGHESKGLTASWKHSDSHVARGDLNQYRVVNAAGEDIGRYLYRAATDGDALKSYLHHVAKTKRTDRPIPYDPNASAVTVQS